MTFCWRCRLYGHLSPVQGITLAAPDDASRDGTPSLYQHALHSWQPAALPQSPCASADWRLPAPQSGGGPKYGAACGAEHGGYAAGNEQSPALPPGAFSSPTGQRQGSKLARILSGGGMGGSMANHTLAEPSGSSWLARRWDSGNIVLQDFLVEGLAPQAGSAGMRSAVDSAVQQLGWDPRPLTQHMSAQLTGSAGMRGAVDSALQQLMWDPRPLTLQASAQHPPAFFSGIEDAVESAVQQLGWSSRPLSLQAATSLPKIAAKRVPSSSFSTASDVSGGSNQSSQSGAALQDQSQHHIGAGGSAAITSQVSLQRGVCYWPTPPGAPPPEGDAGLGMLRELPSFDLQLPDAVLNDEEGTLFVAIFGSDRLLNEPSGGILL